LAEEEELQKFLAAEDEEIRVAEKDLEELEADIALFEDQGTALSTSIAQAKEMFAGRDGHKKNVEETRAIRIALTLEQKETGAIILAGKKQLESTQLDIIELKNQATAIAKMKIENDGFDVDRIKKALADTTTELNEVSRALDLASSGAELEEEKSKLVRDVEDLKTILEKTGQDIAGTRAKLEEKETMCERKQSVYHDLVDGYVKCHATMDADFAKQYKIIATLERKVKKMEQMSDFDGGVVVEDGAYNSTKLRYKLIKDAASEANSVSGLEEHAKTKDQSFQIKTNTSASALP
jgi:cytochrome c556